MASLLFLTAWLEEAWPLPRPTVASGIETPRLRMFSKVVPRLLPIWLWELCAGLLFGDAARSLEAHGT